MKKYFLFLATTLALCACDNQSTGYKQVVYPEPNNSQSTTVDTLQSWAPDTLKSTSPPVERQPYVPSREDKIYAERIKNLKSYAYYISHYFSTGDNKSHVIKLQGSPDAIERAGNEEIYFYGDCEVVFVDNIVDAVSNGTECLKYLPAMEMLRSGDVNASRMAERKLETNMKNSPMYKRLHQND